MKKQNTQTIMVIALISIALCGCPGCGLLIPGLNTFTSAIGSIQSMEDLLVAFGQGFVQGGWMVCVGGLLILIPFVLVVIAVLKKTKKEPLEELEPTGVSKDEPIPPPS